jgi:hypothetical protein
MLRAGEARPPVELVDRTLRRFEIARAPLPVEQDQLVRRYGQRDLYALVDQRRFAMVFALSLSLIVIFPSIASKITSAMISAAVRWTV